MKEKTPRNPKYLDFIRSQPCLRGWSGGCSAGARSEAAHVRFLGGGGVSLKPSDYHTVPLCSKHHEFQHQKGELAFWGSKEFAQARIAVNLVTYCMKNIDMMDFIGALEKIIESQKETK